MTVAVIAGAVFPQVALRDAATLGTVSDVTLRVPPAYVALAPFCGILDALTLLSTRQHYALVATVVTVATIWQVPRALRRRPRRLLRAVAIVAGQVLALVLGYVVCIVLPRPIVALSVTDPAVVAVDFHSHTNHSWDGRSGFTVERNRQWHRDGGWHAAYVTDHVGSDAFEEAMNSNPRRAGDGTTLLPGVECRSDGTHLVILGVTTANITALRPALVGEPVELPDARERLVIQVMPATLWKAATRSQTRVGTVAAIELSNAAPDGLDQMQRQRAALLQIAHRRNLALVSASNNHGWTWTPVSWSLLRIPGWRDLTPEALGPTITDHLRSNGRHAVRVIERNAPDPGPGVLGLAGTVPAVAWRMMATLSPAERWSWLAWAWGLTLVNACLPRWRRDVDDG